MMETGPMCTADQNCCSKGLTFESLLTDPLTRMMMDSDGVSFDQLATVLTDVRSAINAREIAAVGAGLPGDLYRLSSSNR
jgi:hypothetical protein